MYKRRTLYISLSAGALACAVLMLYFLAMESYRAAFWSMLGTILFLESRIRLTSRLQKTALFWAHLCSAIPFACALAALAFWSEPVWLRYVADILAAVLLMLGSAFFWRGVRVTLGASSTSTSEITSA